MRAMYYFLIYLCPCKSALIRYYSSSKLNLTNAAAIFPSNAIFQTIAAIYCRYCGWILFCDSAGIWNTGMRALHHRNSRYDMEMEMAVSASFGVAVRNIPESVFLFCRRQCGFATSICSCGANRTGVVVGCG